jgi:hypothetical protein
VVDLAWLAFTNTFQPQGRQYFCCCDISAIHQHLIEMD